MKTIVLIISIWVLFLIPNKVFCIIRLVPTPTYTNIQAGINSSNNGDTVLVIPGIYYEHLNLNGKNIFLCSKYLTTGDTSYISNTIIDGSNTGRVITINQGENSNCRIIGFTIQHGKATKGGGILISSPCPSCETGPIIEYCNIINNVAYADEGGGITIEGASEQTKTNHTKIKNCIISENTAGRGGGIRMTNVGPDMVVSSCIIKNNTASGGGMFNGGGGGVQIYHSGKIDNCLIINNTTTERGGGVFCDWGSFWGGNQSIFITGSTIANNHAKDGGGTDNIINGGEFRNCIIWENTNQNGFMSNYIGSSFINCCTYPLPIGIGNISSNPYFINPSTGDYRLYAGSQCIESGNNIFVSNLTDLNGNNRIINNTVDIGCYEFQSNILKILNHIPTKYAVNINPNSNIIIKFDQEINQTTLTNNNIRIHGFQTGLNNGTFTYNMGSNTVTINPDRNFTPGEIVEVIITQNIKSIFGTSLKTPYVLNFNIKVDSVANHYHLADTLHQGSPWCAVLSELNNDNRLDAICSNHNHASVGIYKNDSLEIFKRMDFLTNNGLSSGTYDAISADFNNDGFMDIAIAAWNNNVSGKISVWHNKGNLTIDTIGFNPIQQVQVTPKPKYLATSDLNGDGFLDIVVGSISASFENYDFLINNGSGSFTVDTIIHFYHYGWGNVRHCIVDFDSDGDMDVIGGPSCANSNYLMINNGFGKFTQTEYSLGGAGCGAFQAGDFDNDGDADLIGSKYNWSDTVSGQIIYLKNNGTGSFNSISQNIGIAGGPSHCIKIIKDFNADGFLDFAIANDPQIDFYKNNGLGNFTLFYSIPYSLNGSDAFDIGDIDNDGDLDIVIPNGFFPLSLSIYKANNALYILEHPISQSKCTGSNVVFQCKAIGDNIQYSWYKDNILIQGPSVNANLILNSVTFTNAGLYKCIVKNTISNESISSLTATLYIAGIPPTITLQPVSAIKLEGKNSTINLTAVGSPNLFYKWYKNNSYISGNDSTQNYYSINITSIQDAGKYYCIVSNGCGSISSDTISFSVIQRIDSSIFKCLGDSLTINAHVYGSSSYSYQWIKKGELPLPGETDSTFSVLNLISSNSGYYYCQITDVLSNSDTTNSLKLTVDETIPSITGTDGCGIKLQGKSMNFNITAICSSTILYQWFFNDSVISNANNNSYFIPKVSSSDAGTYQCIAYNICGSDTSNLLQLSVIDSINIIESKCIGSNSSFISNVNGSNIYSYQWFKDGAPILTGGNDSIYILDSILTINSGKYYCKVTDSCGNDYTNQLDLFVCSNPPIIQTQPICKMLREGRNTFINVAAIGDKPFAYQWMKNGEFLSSQKDSILKLDNLLIADAGQYRCIVSNACGNDTSDIAIISIIKTTPENTKVCQDLELTSFSIPLNSNNLYQWRKDNSDLLTETDSVLYKSNCSFLDSGYYSCIVTNNCGQDTTNKVKVEFNNNTEWYGYSTDWFNTGNWSCGVPDSTINALIPQMPTGGFWPWINTNTNAVCKGLIIGANIILTMDSATILDIYDTLINYGMLNCAGTIKAHIGSVIYTGDNLVLEPYGSLMHGIQTPEGGGQVIGKVRINKRGWTGFTYNFWSAPVKNSNSQILTNLYIPYKFDPDLAHNDTIYPDNAFQDGWVGWVNKLLTPGVGYASPGADFVSFFDTVNDGNVGVFVKNNGYNFNDGWNLIGNPYPSSISAVDFVMDPTNFNILENHAVYFWTDDWSNGVDYNNSLADFTTIDSIGVITPSYDTNCIVPLNPFKIIPSCQGFEVRVKTNDSLFFKNSMRRSPNSVFYKKSISTFPSLKLGINGPQLSNGNSAYNEIIIALKEDATFGIDKLYDAPKRIGNSNIALYSFIGNEKYCIQALPIENSNKHIPLGLLAGKTGVYSFKLRNADNFLPTTKIILEDKLDNSFTNLLQNPIYNFSVNQTAYINNRFVLHFDFGVTINETTNESNKIHIWYYKNNIYIDNYSKLNGKIKIYNILGQNIFNQNLLPDNNIIEWTYPNGYYIISVEAGNNVYCKKYIPY